MIAMAASSFPEPISGKLLIHIKEGLITLNTLYKVSSCQGLLITNIILTKSSDMLNKNSLAVRKV